MNDAERWEDLALVWSKQSPQPLWRAYSDTVNGTFFRRGLGARQVDRVLKTDLFDEIAGEGLTGRLAEHARFVVGIDLSTSVTIAARERQPDLCVVRCDVRALPFAAGVFPAILSNSTLDHFEDPGDIAASVFELRRVLSGGGDLFLTLDNLANPVIALRNLLPYRLMHRLGLVSYYVGATLGPGGLRRMLTQADLQIVEMNAIMHWPRIVGIVIARVLRQRLSVHAAARLVRAALAFEWLARLPTRFMTGYFVAAHARKREEAPITPSVPR